ncbi:hypothetical protein RFI_00538 [Reticulomyxa filosa]|uniref:Uncharacterized protein n=1 Tax=Reticulomyxa filosa TaxID=46433 RepID=X6PDF9_RETFI|nr:hypothetical protein RFI_00538 [Reticulomyxa filosa]|eukprot:ETO36525.1 hypothetical protein RFI_00538 [Reticulomyxa filosa]
MEFKKKKICYVQKIIHTSKKKKKKFRKHWQLIPNNDCVDVVSDEETSTNVRNGYECSPSANSSVSNDALPLCNPGQSASLLLESESNTTSRPATTCLGLLEEWLRQGCNDEYEYDYEYKAVSQKGSEEQNKEEDDNNNDAEEGSFTVDYAWINSELEKMELAEMEKKAREGCHKKRIDGNNVCAPPVVSLPMPVQMPVSMNVPLNWMNTNYAMPVVTMPVLHFPYQAYAAPNVVNAPIPETRINGTNVYINEQFRYFA